jgi:hypothetical protein
MDIKQQILSFLNKNSNFYYLSSKYFEEEREHLENGINVLTNLILKGLYIQTIQKGRKEEMHNMVRESDAVVFTGNLNNYYLNEISLAKGSAYVSEIFGQQASDLINEISKFCVLKPGTINRLVNLLASVVLHVLNRIFKLQTNEGSSMFDHLLGNYSQEIKLPQSLELLLIQTLYYNNIEQNIDLNSTNGKANGSINGHGFKDVIPFNWSKQPVQAAR